MELIKTHVEFRSDSFPITDKEKEEWDGQVWGYLLAEFISKELTRCGVHVYGFLQEDWGYWIELGGEFEDLNLCCNHYEEFENGFLVFMDPHKPIIRKGFLKLKKVDISDQQTKLSNLLEQILQNHSDITDIRWWDESDMKLIGG
ncbi:hypothetical protein MKI79_01795 [Acinetobacter sp. A3.8]|uniref:Uncharacterized protein n=1 Tax=Acinetobacter sedimenti TaxID=2919922 RepID=A0A9X1WUX1_9GAMM|nr:hypothetical protein [Acinetobacter sedimenti]MCJ8145654.1 hypothetical protein [Acinetobacter sedimenti]